MPVETKLDVLLFSGTSQRLGTCSLTPVYSVYLALPDCFFWSVPRLIRVLFIGFTFSVLPLNVGLSQNCLLTSSIVLEVSRAVCEFNLLTLC